MSDPKLLDLEVDEPITETFYAWLFMIDGRKVWVPKSQCEYDDGILTIPEWLAVEKDIV